MPELFCGFHKRPDTSGPTLYPVACSPQAWAAGSVFMLLQACLGLAINAPEQEIRFTKPTLPRALTELCIKNLRVAGATADLRIYRQADSAQIEILSKTGNLEIVVTA